MVNPVEPSHGITTAPASAPCKSRPMDHILPSHMICSALSSRARSKSAVSRGQVKTRGSPDRQTPSPIGMPSRSKKGKKISKTRNPHSLVIVHPAHRVQQPATAHHTTQPNPTQPNANPSHDARQATQYHRTTIYDLDETHARIHPANTETLACIASHRITSASKPKARPSRLQCNEESRAREIQKESMGLMEESLE